MEINKTETADSAEKKPETTHGNIVGIITTIATCACATFILGAMFDAPWPAAVASCGLSLMGVGVAYVMVRRA